jgi:hypothetical protein
MVARRPDRDWVVRPGQPHAFVDGRRAQERDGAFGDSDRDAVDVAPLDHLPRLPLV